MLLSFSEMFGDKFTAMLRQDDFVKEVLQQISTVAEGQFRKIVQM